MMQVDKQYYENLTIEEVDRILDRLTKRLRLRQRRCMQADQLPEHSYGKPNSWTLSRLRSGRRLPRRSQGARRMTREQVIDEVKKAHIRGRGGAGFDCGTKWSFMPKEAKKPHYLVINADEGEPGTFKDRTIMELNPHSLDRGLHHRRYAHRRARRLHLRARRAAPVERAALGARSTRRAPRATSARRRSAKTTRSTCTCTPAPAPTSAAKRPRCSTRSRASAASRG